MYTPGLGYTCTNINFFLYFPFFLNNIKKEGISSDGIFSLQTKPDS